MGPESARPVAGPAGAAAMALSDPDVRAAVAGFSADDGPEARFAAELAERSVEFSAIVGLLLIGATPGVNPQEAEVVARAVAAGCLGEHHLWRDLQLPNRPVLRKLLEGYFEPFAADNVMDMRWKKFIYRRLCRWGGFKSCRAPSCSACSEYADCFGPES
jgi:nitrogen fixation protein NifQ